MAKRFYSPVMESQEVTKLIARRLADIRKIERLTQQQLADYAYVSLYTIQKFEKTGECSFLTLVKIARALRYMDDFDKLFRFEDKYLATYTFDGEKELLKQTSKQKIKAPKKDKVPRTDVW